MEDVIEEALARWFAQGITSHSHPVLNFAVENYLRPLGIEADALEIEPFCVLETGVGNWWLREPRWNVAAFDRKHKAADDFGYLLEAPDSFSVSVSPRGWLALAAAVPGELTTETFLKKSEGGWLAARHSLQAAREMETFVYAAAGLLLTDEASAAMYAAGEYLGYCLNIRRQTA